MNIYNILFLFDTAFVSNMLSKSQTAYNYRKMYYENHERLEYFRRTYKKIPEKPKTFVSDCETIMKAMDETLEEIEKYRDKFNYPSTILADSPVVWDPEKKTLTRISMSNEDIEYSIIKNMCFTKAIFSILPEIITYLQGYDPEVFKYAYILRFSNEISFDELYSHLKEIFEKGLLNGNLKKCKEPFNISKVKYKSKEDFFSQIKYEENFKKEKIIIIAEEIPKKEYQITYFLRILKNIFTTEDNLYIFIDFRYFTIDKMSYNRFFARLKEEILFDGYFYRSWIETVFYRLNTVTLFKLMVYPSQNIILEKYLST